MRPPSASFCQTSRHRLLTLLLVLLLGYISAHTVNGSPNLGNISAFIREGGTPVARDYSLSSVCSDRLVRIKLGPRKRALDAKGTRRGKYTKLTFRSDGQGHGVVEIQGSYSQLYLCFNSKGRLKVRRYVGSRKDRCLFKEELVDKTYTMLQSVANSRWYVGFNKNGRKMKGFDVRRPKKKRCYYFYKVHHRKRIDPKKVGPLMNVPDLTKLTRRIRHGGKRHNQRHNQR